ncbi:MAG: phosphate signaling complex protein PhoU [Spirulina sp.]
MTLSSYVTPATKLERSLKQLNQDVLRMGTLVEQSFRLSHQALCAKNLDAIAQITPIEKQIDVYYRQIELDCAKIITLQRPVALDLRLLNAFMHLVRDLERIGDYSQDLAELAMKLASYAPHPCLSGIEEMSRNAQKMLATSLMALTELDATAGRQVKIMDDLVDDAYDRLYHTLAQAKDIKGSIEPILLMVLVIRHLERMADHATNIGQRVAYIVTGQRQ